MIKVYTKNYCPFCIKAKKYLKNNGFGFEEVNVEDDPEAKAFLEAQGHKTVPQIYNGDKLLVEGGCDGLLALKPHELQERMDFSGKEKLFGDFKL